MVKKLTHSQILERQKEAQKGSRLPFCAVLNNIRSLYNVGSIFRSADGAGVEKLWLCGITGYPPNTMISKTALGAEENIAWEYHSDCREVLKKCKRAGYEIIFLEQTKESIPYQKFFPEKPVCLVLGNEISGVSDDLLRFCDRAIEIEMRGLKNSLNVSVAFGIAAYQIANAFNVTPVS